MKIILLLIVVVLGIAGCKKQGNYKSNIIKYRVSNVTGNGILVYFKDDDFKKHIVVSGNWEYEFKSTTLDTAYIILYQSVFNKNQSVSATISVNGKIVKSINKYYKESQSDTLSYKLTHADPTY